MTSPLYQISVTKPCLETWEDMQPVSGGRYCLSCQRTVTDFSAYSDEELQQYFLHYKGGDNCGRFRREQVDRVQISIPFYLLKKKQPVWRKFLLLLFICFGSTLFQAEVQVNGGGLYAQTAITGHQVKKKKNKKKIVRKDEKRNIKILTEITLGLFSPTAIFDDDIPVDSRNMVCKESKKKDTVKPILPQARVKRSITDSNRESKTPPSDSNNGQPIVAILPLAFRLRSRADRFQMPV